MNQHINSQREVVINYIYNNIPQNEIDIIYISSYLKKFLCSKIISITYSFVSIILFLILMLYEHQNTNMSSLWIYMFILILKKITLSSYNKFIDNNLFTRSIFYGFFIVDLINSIICINYVVNDFWDIKDNSNIIIILLFFLLMSYSVLILLFCILCKSCLHRYNDITHDEIVVNYLRMTYNTSIEELYERIQTLSTIDIVLNGNNKEFINTSLDNYIIKWNNYVETSSCTICLEDYDTNEEIVKTLCNHYFHKKCIVDWCIMNNSCPICRKVILHNDENV